MGKPVTKRVAVVLAMNEESSRKKLAGIFDYIRTDPTWDVTLAEPTPRARLRPGRYDGMIVGDLTPALARERGKIPVVVLNMPDADQPPNAVYIPADNRAIVQAAAAHLLNAGFDSFAYVHPDRLANWTRERLALFRKALPKDVPFRVWPVPGFADLADWLRDLPQKTAVLAADDGIARQAMLKCSAAGIRVPNDLAFIGVDNDELICESCPTPLTSVEPDFRRGGYVAAQTLARMMDGDRATARHYGVKRLVQRESSRHFEHREDLRMATALAFIRNNARVPIGVADVAAALGVARRTAEYLFRKSFNRSIGEMLRLARLDAMMSRLRNRDVTLAEICATSGFASESHAKRAFKARFGKPMSAFRPKGGKGKRIKRKAH